MGGLDEDDLDALVALEEELGHESSVASKEAKSAAADDAPEEFVPSSDEHKPGSQPVLGAGPRRCRECQFAEREYISIAFFDASVVQAGAFSTTPSFSRCALCFQSDAEAQRG